MTSEPTSPSDLAAFVVRTLTDLDASVATAESLTGGLVCATLVDVPGASRAVAGSVVAYSADAKINVLGVDSDVIAQHGTVARETAMHMAADARRVFGSTWAVSTTGVAGPDPSEGKPVGTVHCAIVGPSGSWVHELLLAGTREDIRRQTVTEVLSLLADRLREEKYELER